MGRADDQRIEYGIVLLDRMEPGLQALEAGDAASWSPEDVQAVLAGATQTLSAGATVVDSAHGIVESIAGTAQAIVEISASIRMLEIETSRSLHKLEVQAPLMERQISRLADRVDSQLERAMSIDPASCSERELDLRDRLLDMAMRLSTQLSDLLMKYMSI